MLRKAQSAANFRAYDDGSDGGGSGSGGARSRANGLAGGVTLDLGVLTPFYSLEAGTFVADSGSGSGSVAGGSSMLGVRGLGGSHNASSGSLNTLRSSTSHAVLHYGSSATNGTTGAGPLRHASSSGSGLNALGGATGGLDGALSASLMSGASGQRAPLHFSLSAAPKSNGQPRGERSELAMLTEKLREMQYEVSRLHRKLRERDAEAEQWSVRYGRRAVLACNLALGIWSFVLHFTEALRQRRIDQSALHRLFIPAHVYAQRGGAAGLTGAAAAAATSAAAASAGVAAAAVNAAASAGKSSAPLSAVLLSGFLTGAASSLPFLLSALLQLRAHAWPRNVASLLSVGYSLLLLLWRHAHSGRLIFRPPLANVINIGANVCYLAARYYFLHGLLVFNSMRIL